MMLCVFQSGVCSGLTVATAAKSRKQAMLTRPTMIGSRPGDYVQTVYVH
jgi:hypothetical protein